MNQQPLAVDDRYATPINTSLFVSAGAGEGVLANDSDPEGGSLVVVGDSGTSIQGGSVAITAEGTVLYVPPSDFFGEDEFSYTVADELGATSVSAVAVVVQPTRISARGVGSGLFPGHRLDPEPSDFMPSLGESVISAGDINGDGFDDLAVFDYAAGAFNPPPNLEPGPATSLSLAPTAPPSRPNPSGKFALSDNLVAPADPLTGGIGNYGSPTGAVYVVFGGPSGPTAPLNAVGAGTGGFAILPSGTTGFSSGPPRNNSAAGDVNGDGFGDLLLHSSYYEKDGGRAWVIFGSASPTLVDLGNLSTGEGIVIDAAGTYGFGYDAQAVGDVNGDGFDDLLFAGYDGTAPGDPIRAWLVLGGPGDSDIDVADASVIKITDLLGGEGGTAAIAGIGDINGDGLDDLFAGNSYAGFGTIIMGSTSIADTALDNFNVPLVTDTPPAGLRWVFSAEPNSRFGEEVIALGDLNGDGMEDFAISISGASQDAGAVQVVFGDATLTKFDLSDIDPPGGTEGYRIAGATPNDEFGDHLRALGDVNGDGRADFITLLGANNSTDPERLQVVYGRAEKGDFTISPNDPDTGFELRLDSTIEDFGTQALGGVGDQDGDGYDDIVFGVRPLGQGPVVPNAYWLPGGDYSGVATHLGSPNADLLAGSAGGDIAVLGLGDDSFSSMGGTDVFRGGAGDDTFVLAPASYGMVSGGGGNDMLVVPVGDYDMSSAAFQYNFSGFEHISMDDPGASTLTMSELAVRELPDNGATLLVTGDAADTLTVSLPGWTESPAGTFTRGPFTLVVQGVGTVNAP